VLLIDQQSFIVAFIGAVELLVKFVLRDNRQQALRVHPVDVGADVLNVRLNVWCLVVAL
jgi:hypothetical protein